MGALASRTPTSTPRRRRSAWIFFIVGAAWVLLGAGFLAGADTTITGEGVLFLLSPGLLLIGTAVGWYRSQGWAVLTLLLELLLVPLVLLFLAAWAFVASLP